MKTQSKITFEKRHIHNQEFQILLEAFNPKQMSPQGLAFYVGSLSVSIAGYENAAVSPVRVPELRKFLQALVSQWGLRAAAHFCDLQSAFFTLLAMSQFERLLIVERNSPNTLVAFCERAEFQRVAVEAALGIWEHGQQAGLKRAVIRAREKQLLHELLTVFKFRNP